MQANLTLTQTGAKNPLSPRLNPVKSVTTQRKPTGQKKTVKESHDACRADDFIERNTMLSSKMCHRKVGSCNTSLSLEHFCQALKMAALPFSVVPFCAKHKIGGFGCPPQHLPLPNGAGLFRAFSGPLGALRGHPLKLERYRED